jgi:4-hydroxy-2-oxoheptanedioate aldolase
MQMPVNSFKQALRNGRPQIGLWVGLADSYVAELLATTGFDWLLIDAEHAPNDPRGVLRQLQAVAPYPVHAMVRPVHGSVELIKSYLDLGVQTLLIPMVETAEQAALVVAATRYPTAGIRGVGSALARSSRWNQIDGYLQRSDQQMCVLVQVESIAALGNLQAIAAVPGVDGVFFGPADLSASMGLIGKPTDPAVQAAIAQGIATVVKVGKAAGCLSSDNQIARDYLAQGATFVAVGVDTSLLVKAASQLAAAFKRDPNAKDERNAKGQSNAKDDPEAGSPAADSAY